MRNTVSTSIPDSSVGSGSSPGITFEKSCRNISKSVTLITVSSSNFEIRNPSTIDLRSNFIGIRRIGALYLCSSQSDSHHSSIPKVRYNVFAPLSSSSSFADRYNSVIRFLSSLSVRYVRKRLSEISLSICFFISSLESFLGLLPSRMSDFASTFKYSFLASMSSNFSIFETANLIDFLVSLKLRSLFLFDKSSNCCFQ